MCANLLGYRQGLFVGDGLHLACAQSFRGRAIVSQIELGSHEDDGDIGGVVFDFREPLERGVVSLLSAGLGETGAVPSL